MISELGYQLSGGILEEGNFLIDYNGGSKFTIEQQEVAQLPYIT